MLFLNTVMVWTTTSFDQCSLWSSSGWMIKVTSWNMLFSIPNVLLEYFFSQEMEDSEVVPEIYTLLLQYFYIFQIYFP